MKSAIVLLASLFYSHVFASARQDTFRKFPNEYFVETGSYFGEGIEFALRAGFSYVLSIELSPFLHQECRRKFAPYPNVILFQGDSGKLLSDMIEDIHSPITFWLDGHYSEGYTSKGDKNSPIMEELEAIKEHPIKNHTILIDDIRLLGTMSFDGVSLHQLKQKIWEINPHYKISFIDGSFPKDILVAEIK